MSHERNTKYLDDKRIVYKRNPITDKPTQESECYLFYEEGTYECYSLFSSKAKITTYRSLKWHLLVMWYLNPKLDQDQFMEISEVIANKEQGFTTFTIHPELLRKMVYDISMIDLENPPKNKRRKVIFKPYNRLCTEDKLRIVGELVGRSKKIHPDDIYQCMLDINDFGDKITISGIAKLLNCSTRTIHRNMDTTLKREKELLNKQL
jgi:hypothetical protein